MVVSLETLSELERKLTISLPENTIQDEVDVRLKSLAPKVQIQGFRQGKVPMTMVRQRFSGKVREEVVREFMQAELEKEIEKQELKLADYPKIDIKSGLDKGDFCFEAHVEIIPEVSVKDLDGVDIELVESSVDASDVQEMLAKLLQQHKIWTEVERASKIDDQVTIDFKGYVDDQAFQGGEATNFKFVLGEKKMLPDFENGLLERSKGQEFSINVKFPDDYGQAELAGKTAKFDIKVHAVEAAELAELNDEFAQKFGVEGGLEGLQKDIEQNMKRELKKHVSQINRNTVFEKLIEANPISLPNGLINREIAELQHELYHQIYGPEHRDNETIPDFPRELFLEKAQRRVHLSLLYFEVVKQHDLKVEPAKFDALLEETVGAYENPTEAKEWYIKDKNRLNSLESLLMEEAVMEKILLQAKPSLKKMNYRETMEYLEKQNNNGDAE
ncbi:MAG: trigger factor [Gammaproteobacteria bacterium]|nr:trigger factor [Gammaproteobacteria bacterium]